MWGTKACEQGVSTLEMLNMYKGKQHRFLHITAINVHKSTFAFSLDTGLFQTLKRSRACVTVILEHFIALYVKTAPLFQHTLRQTLPVILHDVLHLLKGSV